MALFKSDSFAAARAVTFRLKGIDLEGGTAVGAGGDDNMCKCADRQEDKCNNGKQGISIKNGDQKYQQAKNNGEKTDDSMRAFDHNNDLLCKLLRIMQMLPSGIYKGGGVFKIFF